MALLQDYSSLYWLPSQITSHFFHFTLFSSSLLRVVVPPRPGLIEPQKPADSRAFWTFVFFGEIFILSLSPIFKIGSFVFIVVELCKFFIYARYYPLSDI